MNGFTEMQRLVVGRKGRSDGKCNKATTISEQLKIKFALVATNSMALVFTGTAGVCSSWTNAAVR